MAKESMKAREVKRIKLADQYAEKRAALKAAGDHEDISVSLEYRVILSVKWP
jgi:small subunit ribosomal protein S14